MGRPFPPTTAPNRNCCTISRLRHRLDLVRAAGEEADGKLNGRSLSDYGAGKCNLRNALSGLGVSGHDYYPYDLAFPHHGEPRPANLVVCIDVLEHVEEAYLDTLLTDLRTILRRALLLSIHTGPAMKVLSDGRNAYLIQKPAAWWLPRLASTSRSPTWSAPPKASS